ncbi:MAG TPA: ion channel [Chthoniobacterales bacterium]|nr:ion channel [Chthoniobacterales bacterium]
MATAQWSFELLRKSNAGVKRLPFATAIKAPSTHQEDYIVPYVEDLRNAVDMELAEPQPLSGYFLCVLILNILVSPFVDQFPGGFFVETALLTLVFLSALLAIGGRLRTLVGAVLVAPALVGEWLSYWRPDLPFSAVIFGSGLLFIGFVVVEFLRFIVRAPQVDFGVLCAGIATYLMLGLLWSFAYILVDRLVPNSFVFTIGPVSSRSMNDFNALYFSFTTLSTVGYGDIIPLSGAARMLAMVEAVFGMFYVTLLIARLVSLYSSKGPREAVNSEEITDNKRTGSEISQTNRDPDAHAGNGRVK